MFKNILKKKQPPKEPHDLLNEFFINNNITNPFYVIKTYFTKHSDLTMLLIAKNPNPKLRNFMFARDYEDGEEIAKMIYDYSEEWELLERIVDEICNLKNNQKPKSEDEKNNELIDKWLNEQKTKKL